jgi:hypothetical protein
MTKEEFRKLNTIDKINYINTEMKTGKTADEVRKSIGISERGFKKIREENNWQFNQKTKQYETSTMTTTKPLEVSVVEANTNTLPTTEKTNTLDYLSNNINILIDMIEKYKASTKSTTETTTETTTNYITIDLVDDKHLKPKPKSIRINEFIYQEWQEFCNRQHYSKMDLISMALKEYMEKYK